MVETRPATLTYEDYLMTPDDERWELLRGELIMVPGPNTAHQRITLNLVRFLSAFVEENALGEVFISPYDVVLSRTNVLQPDLLFVSSDQQSIITEANIQGAPALVVEVISPSTASKDRELKRRIYAEHGVSEYWLVDPDARTISVMSLQDKDFREVGKLRRGRSPLLPDFRGPRTRSDPYFPVCLGCLRPQSGKCDGSLAPLVHCHFTSSLFPLAPMPSELSLY